MTWPESTRSWVDHGVDHKLLASMAFEFQFIGMQIRGYVYLELWMGVARWLIKEPRS